MSKDKKQIFSNSSSTYFYSSLFFPRKIWDQVAILYAYVRTVDNFVDDFPQDKKGFYDFMRETAFWFRFLSSDSDFEHSSIEKLTKVPQTENTSIIRPFVKLCFATGIKISWLRAFIQSMLSDLNENGSKKIIYKSREQFENYIYGSADVIGLCMSKILNLSPKAYHYAAMQGSAMQHINFIRDIAEDCQLGRQYLPLAEMKKFGLSNLCHKKISGKNETEFNNFIKSEIEYYRKVQAEAEIGYHHIPFRYRIPIATAASLYKWTALKIFNDPQVVFEKKVKPSKIIFLTTSISVFFREMFR